MKHNTLFYGLMFQKEMGILECISPPLTVIKKISPYSLTPQQKIEKIYNTILSKNICYLQKTAISTVFGEGTLCPDVLCIGEAPGAEEDKEGKPFVGASGKLLRLALSQTLPEYSLYITNTVYWRPPGNRAPLTHEIEACHPYLLEQIRCVDPLLILLLGGVAAHSFLKSDEGIRRLRGKLQKITIFDKTYPILASFHPAYLLRQPFEKKLFWQDLLKIRQFLAQSKKNIS